MARLTRRDTGELRRPEKTAEGFLRVEGAIARAGILEYIDAGGKPRHELVTPECLFDPVSMRSFAALALTNTHPPALLTPETVADYQIGSLGDPRPDGDRLVSTLGVLRRDAIDAVNAGRAELSCGYSADVIDEAGTHETLRCAQCGTPNYDAIQKDRRGNHVAIVDRGRAGPDARIRLDSAGNAVDALPTRSQTCVNSAQESTPMPQVKFDDGRTFNLDEANAPALQASISALQADAKARLDAATVRADKLAKRYRSKIGRIHARLDAMMKRNVVCDECKGEKMVDGAKCPSCDGLGMHSARDKMAEMVPAEGQEAPADDLESMAAETENDDPESPEEEQVAQTANPSRADWLRKARKRHADRLDRMTERRGRNRATLLAAASKHLDAAAITGKTDDEIVTAALGKLAPHIDAAALDPHARRVLFDGECKRAETAPQIVNQGDALRAGMVPAPRTNATKLDNAESERLAAETARKKANAWRDPQPVAK